MKPLQNALKIILLFMVLIVSLGIIISWGLNLISLSDTKIYDDENKYINSSLENPDVEENYKDSYKNKQSLDDINVKLISLLNKPLGILFILFLMILFFGLILKYKKEISNTLKKFN